MSAFKLCRLWCSHDEWAADGDWVICPHCGCPLSLQDGYWDPKPGREEECDCPECKRSRQLWKPSPGAPVIPEMPLRDWLRSALTFADAYCSELWGMLAAALDQDPYLESPGALQLRKRQRHAGEMLRAARERWVSAVRLQTEIDNLERELHAARRAAGAYAKSAANPIVEQNLTEATLKAREAQAKAESARDALQLELDQTRAALERMTEERDKAEGALAELQGASRDN